MKTQALFLFLAVVAVPVSANEQRSPMMTDVKGMSHEAAIRNDIGSEKAAYFAKRQRLVRMTNLEPFDSSEPFTLAMFDDKPIIVRRKQVISYSPGSWLWIGEVLHPRVTRWPYEGTLTAVEQDAMNEAANQIEIRFLIPGYIKGSGEERTRLAKEYGINERANRNTEDPQDRFGQVVATEVVENRFDVSKTYWVAADLKRPGLDGRFQIVPIERRRGGMHLIVEVDPDERFYGPRTREELANESASNRQKREAYAEFKRDLHKRVRSQLEGEMRDERVLIANGRLGQ